MPALEITNPANAVAAANLRACVDGASIAERQLEHGARAITAVINASIKLQRLRNRAVALERALARMKARQADLAA